MAQPRDPFYAVKDKVQSSLADLRSIVLRGEGILSGGGTDVASAVESVLAQARADMSQIHVDVKDLSQTITIVEENRVRFPSIDNRELDSRRAFVTDAKQALSHFDDQIKRLAVKAQQPQQTKRAQLIRPDGHGTSDGGSRFASSANAEASRANDDYVANSRQSAMVMEKEQDLVMDDMSSALDRLRGIGDTINVQLAESGEQLIRLDEELDTAKNTMDVVLKKMNKLLGSSDKGRLCCIVLLVVAVVALFFGVIYG